VIAVDQSEAMLTEMKKKFVSFDGIDYRVGEAKNLPIPDETVDYAFANMYLHHVESPLGAIKEMVRIVYRTFAVLEREKALARISLFSDKARFDPNMEPHHHLVCTQCNKVADYHDAQLDGIAPPKNLGGFRARQVNVHIHGLCAECARTEKTH